MAHLRKAAVLLASLDDETATALIEQMDPDAARQVRNLLMELDDVDPAERDAAIEDFLRLEQPCGQVEVEQSVVDEVDTAVETTAGTTAETPRRFSFLESVDPAELTACLAAERPQMTAVVLAHLPGEAAAQVLADLPEDLQEIVAGRLVDLGPADEDALREVERALQSRLAGSGAGRVTGRQTLQAILEAAPPEVRRRIMAGLGRDRTEPQEQSVCSDPIHRVPARGDAAEPHECGHYKQTAAEPNRPTATPPPRRPEPASRVVPQPPPEYVFRQLEQFSDRALSQVFAAAEANVIILALAGASQEMVGRVMSQLSPGESSLLRHALDNLGPTRLSDIEHAQAALARLAGRLAADGRLEGQEPSISMTI